MSLENVPGRDVTYRLISYDAKGKERSENGGFGSEAALRDLTDRTDVVVLSHGWQGDVPAARKQYERWISAMVDNDERAKPLRDREGGFRPLVIGLHWPSKAWGDEELSDRGFSVSGRENADANEVSTDIPESLVSTLADRLEDRPEVRAQIRTLLEIALADPAPRRLPKAAVDAYEELDRQLEERAEGNGAAPGDDREPFDVEGIYRACRIADTASFGGPSLGALLAPLRTMTFWHMKRRANKFGESGAATLLDRLQERKVRVHLMGHSFGCVVMSSAVCGPRSNPRREPVASLTLIQGAMSLWSFAPVIPKDPGRAGYFSRLRADRLVAGPIVASTSHYDKAVRTYYSIAATMAKQVEFPAGAEVELPKYGGIGTWGVQGLDVARSETLNATPVGLHLTPGEVVNVDASNVIRNGSGPSGAHSDICHPAVADAVWQAIVCGSAAQE